MHRTHPQRQPGSPSGPFRADQLRDGDRYEISQDHPLYCAPAGPEHAIGNLTGAAVLGSDPAVEWAGIAAGFSPEPGMLRAPDVAVGARATLRNLLQRFGYADLEAVRAEGREEGRAQAVLSLLAGRGIPVDEDTRARVTACRDPGQLDRWLLAAATVERAAGIFDDDRGDGPGG